MIIKGGTEQMQLLFEKNKNQEAGKQAGNVLASKCEVGDAEWRKALLRG